MRTPALFRCPQTGYLVQQWLEDSGEDGPSHVSVTCPACTRIHFVHRKTGELLGEKKSPKR